MSKSIKKSEGGKTSRPRKTGSKVDVRKRAYEIYLSRDPGSGSPEDDWLRAEEELLSHPGY